MTFQKKCLKKMREAAKQEGRTVLYVSHNMNTIRQLCDRCIVLEKGKVIFEGEVEEGIQLYLGDTTSKFPHNDFTIREHDPWITADIKINYLDMIGDNLIKFGDKLRFTLEYECFNEVKNLCFRFTILHPDRVSVATTTSSLLNCMAGKVYNRSFEIDSSQIAPGEYIMQIVAFEPDNIGNQIRHDYVPLAVSFAIYNEDQLHNFEWNNNAWGDHVLPIAKDSLC